jgi:predicted phage-related endonuclease|tara:strand:+ start:1839 stop:2810 length:972 start_codon:yes stop_codon:yes gene_type:complete
MVGKVTPNDQLSASQIPVLMGASRFKTKNELLKDYINLFNGKEVEFKSAEAMDWGNTLESTILIESALRLGLIAEKDSKNIKTDYDKSFQHQTLPFACSLDGTVTGDGTEIMTDINKGIICVNADKITLSGIGIIEAKLTAHEIESAEDLPLYRGPLQLQMQMDVLGAEWGAVCVLYRGTTLRTFVYKRDDELIMQIHVAILDFQRRLDKYKDNEETEWYDLTSTDEASKIWDEASGEQVDMPELEDSAEQIIDLRQKINSLESEVKVLEVGIMDQMREVTKASAGKFNIGWPMLNYKAQPEKIVPAKDARSIRQSKLKIREN